MTVGALSSGCEIGSEVMLERLEEDVVPEALDERLIPMPAATKAPMSSEVAVLVVPLVMEFKVAGSDTARIEELVVELAHSTIFDSAVVN